MPSDYAKLVEELGMLCKDLNIPDIFTGLSVGLNIVPKMKQTFKPEPYILILDSRVRATQTLHFRSNKEAAQRLLELEKENVDKPHIQAVMASANSLQALPKAYPNYYLDTVSFIAFVNRIISKENGKRLPR